MKKIGTAIRATIVIAWPSMTGCWCMSHRIRTVIANAKISPRTSAKAARYQPAWRSLRGSGTRVWGRWARVSGATAEVVAISRSPSD